MLNDCFQTREVVGSDVDTAALQLNIYTSVVYAFLVIAGIFVIVAFFGCCGAWKVSPEPRLLGTLWWPHWFSQTITVVVIFRLETLWLCHVINVIIVMVGGTKQAAPLLKLLYYWSSHSIHLPPPGLFCSMILTFTLLTTPTIISVYMEDTRTTIVIEY